MKKLNVKKIRLKKRKLLLYKPIKHPKAKKIDIVKNLDSLFTLDVKIAKASPYLLPLQTKKELLDFLIKKHKSETWVWYDPHGTIVGYFSLVDMPKESAMEVLNIGVDPDFQSKGYGRAMMAFIEGLATKNKRRKIILVTNKKNLHAINFYKSIGYTSIKEIANYYGDGETRILFEKTLNLNFASFII